MRVGMLEIVDQVRLLIGDPVTDQVFSNEEIQTVLDAWRTDVFYMALTSQPTIAPGGATSYLTWVAGVGWWEAFETLTDGSYNVLAAATADRQRGVWTFAASQTTGVKVTGAYYDIYNAAADLTEMWMSKLKLEFDFSADNAEYKRSQKMTALRALAIRLRGLGSDGGVRIAQMVREDVAVL